MIMSHFRTILVKSTTEGVRISWGNIIRAILPKINTPSVKSSQKIFHRESDDI